jgi:hypothetical protein
MILESLQLKNFRQFYGETPKIEFASGEKNVTVFHGENGSGKPAVLNCRKNWSISRPSWMQLKATLFLLGSSWFSAITGGGFLLDVRLKLSFRQEVVALRFRKSSILD